VKRGCCARITSRPKSGKKYRRCCKPCVPSHKIHHRRKNRKKPLSEAENEKTAWDKTISPSPSDDLFYPSGPGLGRPAGSRCSSNTRDLQRAGPPALRPEPDDRGRGKGAEREETQHRPDQGDRQAMDGDRGGFPIHADPDEQ